MHRPSRDERAYAAGFFDGEGTVIINTKWQKVKAGKSQFPTYALYVRISQNNPAPLIWIKERWGGSLAGRKSVGGRRASFLLTMASLTAARFLADVAEFLIVKRLHAQTALVFQAFRGRGGRKLDLRPAFQKRNLALKETMRTLNRLWSSDQQIVEARRQRDQEGEIQ